MKEKYKQQMMRGGEDRTDSEQKRQCDPSPRDPSPRREASGGRGGSEGRYLDP